MLVNYQFSLTLICFGLALSSALNQNQPPPKTGLGGLNIIRAALQLSDTVRLHHAPCQG